MGQRKFWMRDDDPKHYSSLEEAKNAPLPEGPVHFTSYFQVVKTPEGSKFFAWGNSFSLALCLQGSGLKMSDRIDVKTPNTYAELRALKASFGE